MSSNNSNICGACDHIVSWSEKGVACETCGRWYHALCQSIGSKSYENLGASDVIWHCDLCGNHNFSTTMFDLHGVERECSIGDLDSNISIDSVSDFHPYHSSTPSRRGQQNKFRSRPLRILNVNFQSMIGKKAETYELIERTKPDIIIGTETWLKSDIKDSELLTKHYKIYRKDRNRVGGGVMIGVKEDLQSTEINNLNSDCEVLWVKILTRTQKPVYVCSFYRPDVKDIEGLQKFEDTLKKASEIKNVQLIVAGDFNLRYWDWVDMKLKPKASYVDSHREFVELLDDLGMQQMVLEPTRESNILDLVLTNTPDLIPRVEVIPGLSDHNIVYFEYNVKPERKHNALRQIYLYRRADWEQIKKEMKKLEKDIGDMIDSEEQSLDDIWEQFKNSLIESMNRYIPRKVTKPRDSKPWITAQIKKLIKKRDRLSKHCKKSPSDELKEKFKECRREVKRTINREYWKYVCTLFEEYEDEVDSRPCLKRFWTYIKHQRTSSVGVSPLKSGGKLITDSSEKAEILNKQFFTAFSEGGTYSKEEFHEKCKIDDDDTMFEPMKEIDITVRGIEKLLAGLNPSKATGPDGLPPRVLKELSTQLAPILTMIYKLSLKSGKIPTDWRQALVTPLFKKGEQYEAVNYRPVSLTSIPCKILEHVIVSNLMKHFDDNNILCQQQHGFRRGRSCESQLLEFVEEVSSGLDDGFSTEVVVMDFAKAFDRVNHSLLTHKLAYYGVRGTTNSWISDFLSNRSQRVVVEGEKSTPVSVRSGVPQGSVLGPCLFLSYINDLPERVTSTSRLFADDTLLHRLMREAEDRNKIQHDLENLELWENEWDMHFHPSKCSVLPISKAKRPKSTSQFSEENSQDYILHNQKLEKVSSTKYLGVTLQNDLKFDQHIDNISGKANKMLGLLRRNLRSAPKTTKELGYKALVRPILEYASSVWDPYEEKDITKIEKVQRRAARFVLNRYRQTDSVTAMLEELGWHTLQQRRRKARLSMLHKINSGQVHIRFNKLKKLANRSGRRRGHSEMFERITYMQFLSSRDKVKTSFISLF